MKRLVALDSLRDQNTPKVYIVKELSGGRFLLEPATILSTGDIGPARNTTQEEADAQENEE